MKELFNNPTFKKVWSIVSNVLLYLFIAICLIGVILTITAKKDEDGTATIFGMQMRLVISPSMEKCDATDVSDFEIKDIPVNSMVFIEVVPTDPTEAPAGDPGTAEPAPNNTWIIIVAAVAVVAVVAVVIVVKKKK